MHKVSVNCKILLIFLAAYLFGFAARMLWVLWAKDMPEFYFNGEFMLTTNDAYYYAEGARDMLASFHQQNDSSPFNHPISTIVFTFQDRKRDVLYERAFSTPYRASSYLDIK